MKRPPHEPLDPQERELADRLARIAPRGEPSPQLDARILAAARAAVDPPANVTTGPRSRWPLGLGIAASTVLALGIAWQLRPVDSAPQASEQPQADVGALPAAANDGQDASTPEASPPPMYKPAITGSLPAPMASTSPAAASKAAPPALRKPAPSPEMPAAPVAAAVEAPLEISEPRPSDVYAPPQRVMSAPPPPAPPAPPAFVAEPPMQAEAAQAEAVLARETAERQARRQATQQADAAVAAKAARARAEQETAVASDIAAYGARNLSAPPSADVEDDARLSIEHWLEQIALRQRLGDIDGARRSLSLFRQAHPQHPIPDDLKPLLAE